MLIQRVHRYSLKLDSLRGFLALSEHQSYKKAAQVLGVEPKILIETVGVLQARLGVMLLTADAGSKKSASPLELTRVGQAFKTLAADYLTACDTLRGQTSPQELLLRVAVSDGVSQPAVESKIRALRHNPLSSPSTPFTCLPLRINLDAQRAGLRSGVIDMGFSQTAKSDEDRGLSVNAVWREPLVAFLPKNYLLADQDSISLETLTRHWLAVTDPQQCGYGGQILSLLERAGDTTERDTLKKVATVGDLFLGVFAKQYVGLLGAEQWESGGGVWREMIRPVVDEQGEPLWLTTYLRHPASSPPALADTMAMLLQDLETNPDAQGEAGVTA